MVSEIQSNESHGTGATCGLARAAGRSRCSKTVNKGRFFYRTIIFQNFLPSPPPQKKKEKQETLSEIATLKRDGQNATLKRDGQNFGKKVWEI